MRCLYICTRESADGSAVGEALNGFNNGEALLLSISVLNRVRGLRLNQGINARFTCPYRWPDWPSLPDMASAGLGHHQDHKNWSRTTLRREHQTDESPIPRQTDDHPAAVNPHRYVQLLGLQRCR